MCFREQDKACFRVIWVLCCCHSRCFRVLREFPVEVFFHPYPADPAQMLDGHVGSCRFGLKLLVHIGKMSFGNRCQIHPTQAVNLTRNCRGAFEPVSHALPDLKSRMGLENGGGYICCRNGALVSSEMALFCCLLQVGLAFETLGLWDPDLCLGFTLPM